MVFKKRENKERALLTQRKRLCYSRVRESHASTPAAEKESCSGKIKGDVGGRKIFAQNLSGFARMHLMKTH